MPSNRIEHIMSDDAKLLAQIAQGDRAAMKAFYFRHEPPLQKFLERKVSDPFLVADIVQETFLDVWRSASRFEGRSKVKTWLFTMARYKMIDTFRKLSREMPLEDDHDSVDEGPTPEAILSTSEVQINVRECIDKLSNTHARAVRLAFFEGLTYAEISTVENVPVSTIKTRIFHAKKLLMRYVSASRAS